LKHIIVIVGATLVASALIATEACAANLIHNGDFANIGKKWTDNTGLGSNDWQTGGNVAIPDWSNVSGFANEFWVKTPNDYDGLTASPKNGGIYFVDLTGQANNLPFGGLEQTITTTPGDKYILSFYLGASAAWNSGSDAESALTASATGTSRLASKLFTASTPTTDNQWQRETLYFTADSASTTIEFLADSADYNAKYIGLDNVRVRLRPEDVSSPLSPAVPEPSSWAMIVLGFFGLAFAGYRNGWKGRLSQALE
jgi:hypothetical protein